MPSKSEAQRRLFAAARAYKRGEYKGEPSEKIKELAASMSDEDLSDFMHKKATNKGKEPMETIDKKASLNKEASLNAAFKLLKRLKRAIIDPLTTHGRRYPLPLEIGLPTVGAGGYLTLSEKARRAHNSEQEAILAKERENLMTEKMGWTEEDFDKALSTGKGRLADILRSRGYTGTKDFDWRTVPKAGIAATTLAPVYWRGNFGRYTDEQLDIIRRTRGEQAYNDAVSRSLKGQDFMAPMVKGTATSAVLGGALHIPEAAEAANRVLKSTEGLESVGRNLGESSEGIKGITKTLGESAEGIKEVTKTVKELATPKIDPKTGKPIPSALERVGAAAEKVGETSDIIQDKLKKQEDWWGKHKGKVIVGGLGLGAAYAGYKYWQWKKEQEEKAKQNEEFAEDLAKNLAKSKLPAGVQKQAAIAAALMDDGSAQELYDKAVAAMPGVIHKLAKKKCRGKKRKKAREKAVSSYKGNIEKLAATDPVKEAYDTVRWHWGSMGALPNEDPESKAALAVLLSDKSPEEVRAQAMRLKELQERQAAETAKAAKEGRVPMDLSLDSTHEDVHNQLGELLFTPEEKKMYKSAFSIEKLAAELTRRQKRGALADKIRRTPNEAKNPADFQVMDADQKVAKIPGSSIEKCAFDDQLETANFTRYAMQRIDTAVDDLLGIEPKE
jgi:hypothetical protein